MDKTVIHEIGKRMGFSQWQAEKDYLQHIFLYELYSFVNRELVFKGGTCLQKAYGLHRFSRDLDFNLTTEFNANSAVLRVAKKLTELGFPNKVSKTEETQYSLNFLVEFSSQVMKNSLTIQISKREMLLMPPKQVAITPLYTEIPPYFCVCMAEEEIAAEKIRAIYQRAFPRDVYDFWFLLLKGIRPSQALVSKKLSRIKEKYEKEKLMLRVNSVSKNWVELSDLLVAYPPFESVVADIEKKL